MDLKDGHRAVPGEINSFQVHIQRRRAGGQIDHGIKEIGHGGTCIDKTSSKSFVKIALFEGIN